MKANRRMKQWGKKFLQGRRQCPCKRGDCLSLNEISEGSKGKIFCNNDIRTIERGIYVGADVSIFRNEASEPNVIVAVGDARYVLDRRIAQHIRVRVE